jgi:hypothetical protein
LILHLRFGGRQVAERHLRVPRRRWVRSCCSWQASKDFEATIGSAVAFSHAANQPARSIFLAIGLFLHFLSAIIALDRRLVNSGSIFIVNLFLGWTLICWVGTLAWALSGTSLTKPAPN